MRKNSLIGILVVVLFLFPLLNTSTDYSPATTVSNPYLPQAPNADSPFAVSADRSTGNGPALPVTISGQISNVGQGTLSFDSSSSGIGSVMLTDGWTGSNLQAQIDSLTWTAEDVLQNGNLNDYHNELFVVTPVTTENDDTVQVPDDWTIVKNVVDYDSLHPQHGMYEIDSDINGNGGTRGIYVVVDGTSVYNYNPNDEMYISQMVSMPYREIYSATVSFEYNILSTSYLDNVFHLFIRLGGRIERFPVFQTGATTGTWLSASVPISASLFDDPSAKALLFDIGIATDYSGVLGVASREYAYIDNIRVDFNVRPFPEQIDLKANGTLVWGSTTHSVYPYVPDDDNRDCYDDSGSGLDLDGYSGNAVLDTGIYSSGYLTGTSFETGLQFPLDIPQGAIITSAYLEVEAASSSSPFLLGMRVHVADEDNVTPFTTGGHLEALYNWVETSVDWSLNSWIVGVDTRYRSPEIGPLVQNVVSRPGWSEGNYILLMTSMMYADYYQRWSGIKGTYASFYSQIEFPRLFVEYLIPEPEDTVLSFNYQKDITIDHLDVAANLTDFPVLIDITGDANLRDNVLSDGNDIAFTIGGTPVEHEIEFFNQTAGDLIAWVKVPFLSSSIDTVITMNYGCENAQPAIGSRVWSDYETVHHLNQDPTGTNYDSTSNNHDGTSYGGLGTSDFVDGQIGNAIDFDGTNDVISIGQINTDEWTQFTMSAWFYRTLDKDARIFSKSTTTTSNQHIITLRLDPTNHVTTRVWADPQASGVSYSSTPTASNFTWHYVSWSWDPSRTGHEILAYLDGTLILDRAYTGTSIRDSDAMFVIGNNDLVNSRYWAGVIDEPRLTTIVRSEEWIDTEYVNQLDPTGFYTIGLQRAVPNTWSDAGETQIEFTTSSPSTVTMDVIVTMDVGGAAQTMDTDFNEGVEYFIETGSNIVNWTTKVLVSPPAGATSFGFTVEYPRAEWKATKVLNPLNQPKTLGSDWWYEGGTLTLNATSIDFWGVWTLKFISWNFMQDLQTDKVTYDSGDLAKFTMTTPTVLGARVGLDIVDPNGVTQYTLYNQTTTDPAHRFPSFRYRKDITIPDAEIYGTVNNFPVLIQLTDTDLRDTNKVRSDASDILFAVGDTILDHEIEFFDQTYGPTDAFLTAWVKMNLTDGVDNTLTMYYGAEIVDNLENPTGLWSNDYEAVWHLGETTASGSIHYDSTGNGHDGSRNGNSEVFSGAGYSQSFDGISDYISIDPALTPQNDVMITGWFRLPSTHTATSPNTRVIMEKYIDIDYDMLIALVGQDYGQGIVPNGSLVFKMESAPNDAMYKWTQSTTWAANTWYFFACYADEDNPANNKIWINMNWNTDPGQVGSPTQANMSYIEEVRLGGGNWDSGIEGSGYFSGRLDEFTVSNSLRSDGWLRTQANNFFSIGSFVVPGTEQGRTSPEHSRTWLIANTDPVGQWTAIAYYNDTGTTVTNKTGLFEKTFIIRHDTALTLSKPTDAVGDRLSVKTAGDALFIEYELRDSNAPGNPGVTGATVTINWTTPSTITLDDHGGGLYGTVLDTADLGTDQRWRVDVQSYHQYYHNATEYFDVDLYHATTLTAAGGSTTPADFIFNATLTFRDSFTGAPITGATITEADGTPVTYVGNPDGTYDIQIPTTLMSLGLKQYTFNATVAGSYLLIGQVDVSFTVRAHYTATSVSGDMTTPYGSNTDVTIHLHDLDTGTMVDIADVDTMTFSFTGGYPGDTSFSFTKTLTTNSWNVSTVTATLTITMADTRLYRAPNSYVFNIQILAHGTSMTVTGVTTTPYGNQTYLTVALTDLETGGPVPFGSVASIELQHAFGTDSGFTSFDYVLDTSAWPVGTHTVTVVLTILGGEPYNNPSNYQFQITIRSMSTVMYHDPSPLNFPLGADFSVDLRLNVSEPGPNYGNPITGRIAGEFSVPGYVISIGTTEQAVGRYKLSISASYFTGGTYQIIVFFTSADNVYANTFVVIQFLYREVDSTLTSPNYPQVTTPYQLDVKIVLNYTDIDFGSGIEGATITSPDHPTWIANWSDNGFGIYGVWIDVSTLSQGIYYLNLTADKSGIIAKTLEFRIVIRSAYTSVIPTVGSLNIPIGNSYVFYAEFTDTDRLIPIDNSSAPYTLVSSTWGNFSVVYESLSDMYRITFYTSDSDTISQNIVYTFTFSKGANYQVAEFTITVSIRTHNTDFRIVSSIEPTSTIGIFNISVYYGDLDNAIGVKSASVDFWVENASGVVSSSYAYDLILGDGFYIIQVPAAQFGLGLQTLTVHADWTGVVAIYQDKSFVTTANVVGRESALTLLVGSAPTPYNEDMAYTFLYSDLFSSVGIDNLTGNVFIYVSFTGESVSPDDVVIVDLSLTEAGNYSIQFNTGIFSRTGLIYMNVFVNWSKGVSPYYANRTDVVSLTVLRRDTLLSISPPSATSYNENATFTLTFEDIGTSTLITGLTKDQIALNISFSLTETAGVYTISFNTNQYPSLGTKAIRIDVTWTGAPFYASRIGRITYINIIYRETYFEYLTPPPTPYGDQVIFNVTWTDITSGASDPITSATLELREGSTPINLAEYSYFEIAPGIYQVTLNTTYVMGPGTDTLRIIISAGVFYIADRTVDRLFTVDYRLTVVAANPVVDVPYNSSILITLNYLDQFTGQSITNDSAHVTILVTAPSGAVFTSSWIVQSQEYELVIHWNPSWSPILWAPGTVHDFTVEMSYDSIAPFYDADTVSGTFKIRIRDSTLALDTEPETTPYLDDAIFILDYTDDDASGTGIEGALVNILDNNSIPLNQGVDYIVSDAGGFYTITVHSTALGTLGTHTLRVQLNWSGAPYHENVTRNVNVLVRQRETNLDITVPPSQTLYFDDVSFTFQYLDVDADIQITTITSTNIRLRWPNSTVINSILYTVNQVGGLYEIIISSTVLSTSTVSGLSLRVEIDWDGGTAPYYKDDSTIVKITITRRTMLVETSQIERTPKGDLLNISVLITDLDSELPVDNAIILFSCRFNPSMSYSSATGFGYYNFTIDTSTLLGTGTFLFDIEIQWDPTRAPFYANRSVITLTGLVDLVRTTFTVDIITPSSVQYTGTVSLLVTWQDLDHGVPMTGYAGILNYSINYLAGGRPLLLNVFETGTLGEYNITFSTSDRTIGAHTLVIIAEVSPYSPVTVTPQFSVVPINTELTPMVTSITDYWKNITPISVDYLDLFNGVPISSAASVTWSYAPLSLGGILTEVGSTGTYEGLVDTNAFEAGTFVLTITATKSSYSTAITTITLVVLRIPSEMSIISPTKLVYNVSRGDPVFVQIELMDPTSGFPIGNTAVLNESGNYQVYAELKSERYYMLYDVGNGLWNVTIPGSATVLEALLSYDVQIFAGFKNYDPAVAQFTLYIQQASTQLKVIGLPDPTKHEVYYLQEVTIELNFTAPNLDMLIDNASVRWLDSTRNISLDFTSMGNGIWSLTFNTSILGFGTVGVSFYGSPANSTLADTLTSMTLTVKKIPTSIDGPTELLNRVWGWQGNIALNFSDDYNDRNVAGATVTFNYGNLDFNATDLGNGTYVLYIDTTILDSGSREKISTSFILANYEERSFSFYINVEERPTELIVSYPDQNHVSFIEDVITLELTMGDAIDISLFYNDTNTIGGLLGGIEGANFTAYTELRAPSYFSGSRTVVFIDGFGYYNFTFDTNDVTLYDRYPGPTILEGDYFTYTIEIFSEHRALQKIEIRIRIIETPTEIIFDGDVVDPDTNIVYTITNGEEVVFDFYIRDTWHDVGVPSASYSFTSGATAIISSNTTLGAGNYRLIIRAVDYGGDSLLTVTLSTEFHDDVEMSFLIHTEPNDFDILFRDFTRIGLPISLFVILLLGAYVRVWSVPKRIRQINGQLKALRKGKVPKPIGDVKSRQQLAAELFNDTFSEFKITRTAAQMPEDAIPIEVPEMGELLMQLAILTNLSQAELDEFQADINKMKMSEQAAFVKEVIMQEAIRAARRDGKTIEETLATVEQEAIRRLGGEEEIAPVEVVEPEETETVFLEEGKEAEVTEEKSLLHKDEVTEEGPEVASEKMSLYEIEELRRDLERRGVPPHEIDTIVEQAKELPRELVDELVKSLEGKKD